MMCASHTFTLLQEGLNPIADGANSPTPFRQSQCADRTQEFSGFAGTTAIAGERLQKNEALRAFIFLRKSVLSYRKPDLKNTPPGPEFFIDFWVRILYKGCVCVPSDAFL